MTPTVQYTLVGEGHSWPGGKPSAPWRVGAAKPSIDATSVIRAFFQEQRRERSRGTAEPRCLGP
jgi:poly(3-hydroxybutyrate) depolymerase